MNTDNKNKEKYKWQKEGETYTVFHQQVKVKTMIAITDTSEKAHLLATACNALAIKQKTNADN